MAGIAEQSSTFSRACVALSAPHLTDKLGDMKLKKPSGDLLLTFSEKTSLSFVLGLCESSSILLILGCALVLMIESCI